MHSLVKPVFESWTSVNLNRVVFFQDSEHLHSPVKPTMDKVNIGAFTTASLTAEEIRSLVKPTFSIGQCRINRR